jgi:hypothetical protein
MAALTGVAAQAAENAGAPAERHIIVCMEGETGAGLKIRARSLASNIFAGIGVTVHWRNGFDGCPSQAIRISITDHTPDGLKSGALAYARPYDGTHIRVFYDRIVASHYGNEVPLVLGHVFAHEIAHILERISRHSASGIMKDRWQGSDFSRMHWKPLEFADEDIDLIYRGLAGRARALVAVNAAPETLAGR